MSYLKKLQEWYDYNRKNNGLLDIKFFIEAAVLESKPDIDKQKSIDIASEFAEQQAKAILASLIRYQNGELKPIENLDLYKCPDGLKSIFEKEIT